MTPIEVSKIDFIEGAKWQEKKMYSEEEVLEIILFVKHLEYMDDTKPQYEILMDEILQQFKKK
jgi:hypothetical protein